MTVTVVIGAHNEAAQIADCLESVTWADEIIVVADRCTDETVPIAKRYTEHVLEGTWLRESERRHVGIDHASSEWVLEMDSDERVSPELARDIRTMVGSNPDFDYVLVPFDNYVGKRLVRYGWGGSFGTSAVIRLFRKGQKKWDPAWSHTRVHLQGKQGPMLTGRMIHYVDEDIADMIQRLNRYTTNRARDMREKGIEGSIPGDIRRIFTRFFKCYVQRKGYKEGYYGFLIALMAGLFPLLSTLKAQLEPELHDPRPDDG